MRTRIALLLIVGLAGNAVAQEFPDMLGTWSFSVEGIPAHPTCGESFLGGVMDVERKITPRAYRGMVRTESAYENCATALMGQSAVTVRVHDATTITVAYDAEGWQTNKLQLADSVMTGKTHDGLVMRWVRNDGASIRPSEQQLADLDVFLTEIRPQVSDTLHDHYYDKISKALVRASGLEASEAGEVTSTMVSHMTSCMMDQMTRSALAGEIPVSQITRAGNAILMFDPEADEFIGDECVENAALNAGIRLR